MLCLDGEHSVELRLKCGWWQGGKENGGLRLAIEDGFVMYFGEAQMA